MIAVRRPSLWTILAVTTILWTPRLAPAADKGPIRVGFIAPFSGPFAQNAGDMWEWFRQHFDEVAMQAAGR